MSALTVRLLEGVIRYQVGAPPGTALEFRELVNMAGHHLVSMHPWLWLEGRSARLTTRASIDISDGTWTEATKTLTKTGAFASYSFLTGDSILITAGTGATVGRYEVKSKTSSDAIVLLTSIGSAANGSTDIDGHMANDQVALPSDFDFQAVTAIQTVDGLVSDFSWTNAQGMLDLRSWPGLRSTVSFRGLLRWVRTSTTTSVTRPVPRFEVWPETSTAQDFVELFYRGGWITPDDDGTDLLIPDWLNALYIEILKALVDGYENPEEGSVDARLSLLPRGFLFQTAVARDAMIQAELGPMENGWMGDPGGRVGRYDVPTPIVTGFV